MRDTDTSTQQEGTVNAPELFDLTKLIRAALKVSRDPRGEAERQWGRFTAKLDQSRDGDRRRPPRLW